MGMGLSFLESWNKKLGKMNKRREEAHILGFIYRILFLHPV
jgi:hypothetical protein